MTPAHSPDTRSRLRIGTRGSRLARWQSDWVAAQLRIHHPGLTIEIVEIKTLGDRDRNSPLAAIGGAGVFTKEIQRALIEHAADVAVHSLKDLPTDGPASLVIGAVPQREATADVLIAPRHRTLAALPEGARVGTGSLRRRAQILYVRPDLEVSGLRGNVETRLAHAIEGRLDGVVLAEAGLRRLGLEEAVTERLGAPGFLPAVGQGALGIECRAEDHETRTLLTALDHGPTHRAIRAERALLAELGGGCLVPLGALAREVDGELWLDAALLDPAGVRRLAASLGPSRDPEALGRDVAGLLREQGAAALLESIRPD